MAENLKAFESLKENENASLSSKEKADLRKISPDDIKSQKEKVGDKPFVVGGKPMKLKDVVKNLVFDEKGKVAKMKVGKDAQGKDKFETIGWESELGAAIQVYAIANNKSIGEAGIDGKVGRDTIKGLQSTQNAVKADERSKKNPERPVDQDEVKEQSVARLANAIYTEYVGKYKDAKYNLLDTRAGVNQGTLKNKTVDGNKVTITYKSAIGKKENQVIVVDASTCKVGKQYSVDKFGKAIENAISRKEAELKKAEDARIAKEKLEAKQEAIVKAVESFDVRQFSAKAQAYLKEKNFVSGNRLDLKDGLFSGTGIAFDEKGNLHFGNAFYMTKSQIDSTFVGGKFNSDKFKSILNPYLEKKANEHFTAKSHNLANKLKNTKVTVGSLSTAENSITETEKEINKIGSLGISVSEDKKVIEAKKKELQIVKDYKEVSTGMDNILKEIEKQINKYMSPVETKKLKDKVIHIDKGLTEKWYAYNKKNVHDVYSKMANGNQKYQELANRVRKIKNQIV